LGSIEAALILTRRSLSGKANFDATLLRIPAVGLCLEALALSRFCMPLRLTGETGMAVEKSLRLSLHATGNEAFAARGKTAETAVKKGKELTEALAGTGLYPDAFLHILAVGEESGQITEVCGVRRPNTTRKPGGA
jgi:type II secretory pathway component PulF